MDRPAVTVSVVTECQQDVTYDIDSEHSPIDGTYKLCKYSFDPISGVVRQDRKPAAVFYSKNDAEEFKAWLENLIEDLRKK